MSGNDLTVRNEMAASLLLDANNPDVKKHLDANYVKMLLAKHPGLPQEHVVDFLHKAQLSGADPRLNEVYLVEYNTRDGKAGTTIFDYKFFIKKLREQGNFKGLRTEQGVGEYVDPVTSTLQKKAFVKAILDLKDGGQIEFIAWWPEWAQTYKDGNPKALWATKPMFMLGKCAIANVARMGADLSGMFIPEEMEAAIEEREVTTIEAEVVERAEDKATKTDKTVETSGDYQEKEKLLDRAMNALKVLSTGMTQLQKADFAFSYFGCQWKEISKTLSVEQISQRVDQIETAQMDLELACEGKTDEEKLEIISGMLPDEQ